MSSEEINPFASPEVDDSASSPLWDEDFPYIATTKGTIEKVPYPFGGVCRSFKLTLLRWVLTAAVYLIFIIPFALATIYVPSLGLPAMPATLVIMGIAVGFYLLAQYFSPMADREAWWRAKLVEQLCVRPGALIAEALESDEFVTLTTGVPEQPRSFQLTLGYSQIVDVGFLRFDRAKGELLIEGDTHRYRLPRGCLWSSELQEIPLESQATMVVRLVVETEDGPREVYLRPHQPPTWSLAPQKKQEERANKLLTDVHEVLLSPRR